MNMDTISSKAHVEVHIQHFFNQTEVLTSYKDKTYIDDAQDFFSGLGDIGVCHIGIHEADELQSFVLDMMGDEPLSEASHISLMVAGQPLKNHEAIINIIASIEATVGAEAHISINYIPVKTHSSMFLEALMLVQCSKDKNTHSSPT